MFGGNGCANCVQDFVEVAAAMFAARFSHDDELFFFIDFDSKRGGPFGSDGRVRIDDRQLDVLRIYVAAAQNNQVFPPTGDV